MSDRLTTDSIETVFDSDLAAENLGFEDAWAAPRETRTSAWYAPETEGRTLDPSHPDAVEAWFRGQVEEHALGLGEIAS